MEYVYGNQFFGDPDITAYADNWYQNLGVQAVFACGGRELGEARAEHEASVLVAQHKAVAFECDRQTVRGGACELRGGHELAERGGAGLERVEDLDRLVEHPHAGVDLVVGRLCRFRWGSSGGLSVDALFGFCGKRI